ncbi:MAG: YceD family protein [Actinomycetota bacterium]
MMEPEGTPEARLEPIDVRDLLGQPGASRHVTIRGTVTGLGTELAHVPDDAAVMCELLLESVVEGILVSGRLSGVWRLSCARCLTEFDAPFEVEVHELFVPEPDPDADDYRLDPEIGVELEQLVRDAVGVEMPFSPLCRSGCLGLCETCGGNRNLGECPGHETVDPRFAILSDLFPSVGSGEGQAEN